MIMHPDLAKLLSSQSLIPHFMPIVDALSGGVIGFEVVMRGAGELGSPAEMFRAADEAGERLALEGACVRASLAAIAKLGPSIRGRHRFFLNVGSAALSDNGFREELIRTLQSTPEVPPECLVLEITDKDSVSDYQAFSESLGTLVRRGLQFALDEFGAGHASLVHLAATRPHFLKLAREVLRNLPEVGYQQELVAALTRFAGSMDARLVAEGVESWEQFDLLLRLGIRYHQGRLFGMPAPEPVFLSGEMVGTIRRKAGRHLRIGGDEETPVGRLASMPTTVEVQSLTCQRLDQLFLSQPHVDHVVLVKSRRPISLLTRQQFYSSMAGPGSMEVLGDKPIDILARPAPTIVRDDAPVTALARSAMSRIQEEVYDPVLVVDAIGGFVGSIPVRELITAALEEEVQRARDTNPVTALPGSRLMESWIVKAFSRGEGAIVYTNIVHFRDFNDQYGLARGNDLLRYTARLLQTHLAAADNGARIGHIGGDEFVIILPHTPRPAVFEALCEAFDEGRRAFFDGAHLEQGFFPSSSQEGYAIMVPLVPLAIAVLTDLKRPGASRLADLAPRVGKARTLARTTALARGHSAWVNEPPAAQ